jgi:hypothetical protein
MLVDVNLMGEIIKRPGIEENRDVPLDCRECRDDQIYV